MGNANRYEEEELLRRAGAHSDGEASESDHIDDPTTYELDDLEHAEHYSPPPRRRTSSRWPWSRFLKPSRQGKPSYFSISTPRRRRSLPHRVCRLISLLFYIALGLLVICGIFFPSYSRPPQRYHELRKRVQNSQATGAGNLHNQKIFIAASIYERNGELISGDWGKAIKGLVDVLGPENVFLSIYENDADETTKKALQEYKSSLSCNSSIVTEHLDLRSIAHVTTPAGRARLKRIAFLAEVRNRALRPLEDEKSPAFNTHYDKLLYVNDVVFEPIDAANLLFSTNADKTTGETQYRAACATDFIDPVKFYDRFATRDLEGYTSGVPFYPFFTSAGQGISRKDVQAQKDAVRVKSCWGGMVAFEAKWFRSQPESTPSGPNSTQEYPLRFRAETDTYWDASECCLINADLSNLSPSTLPSDSVGIYMNPYIRVAYSTSVLNWLHISRRFERLMTPIQTIATWIVGFPDFNPRREQQPGEEVSDRVWIWDDASKKAMKDGTVSSLPGGVPHGKFEEVLRTATPGQFCGTRRLLYINENPGKGESKWGDERVPSS